MATEEQQLEKVLAQYSPEPNTGCWLWSGYVTGNGYGSISINGLPEPVHRFIFRKLVRPIISGYEIDHLCNTPICINPKHLEQKTPKENKMRSNCPPAINAKRTSCIHGHSLSGENLYLYKRKDGTRRYCKQCMRDRKKQSKERDHAS